VVIGWDEPKRLRNLEVHGFDFADVERSFDFAEATISPGHPGPDGRRRWVATGFLGDDLVSVVFAPLGTEAVSLISVRIASRKERKRHNATPP